MATKPKKIWDNYKEIGEVRKSDGIKFIIAAATREGYRYINIREFYLRKKDNVWRPGRDGITIPLKAPLNMGAQFIEPYSDMVKVLAEAAAFVSTMELEDDEHAVWMQPKEA